jgi:hypothetical protein
MPADPSAWSVIGIGGAILACFVAFTFVTNRRIYRELIATAGFSR